MRLGGEEMKVKVKDGEGKGDLGCVGKGILANASELPRNVGVPHADAPQQKRHKPAGGCKCRREDHEVDGAT